MYADVLFPLKLPALTYRIPEGFPFDIQGFVVRAQLGRRKAYGIVSDVRRTAPAGIDKGMKDLSECCMPFADKQYLKLIKWLSEYYLTAEGIALKSCFFDDFTKAYFGRSRKTRSGSFSQKEAPLSEVSACTTEGYESLLSEALDRIRSEQYSASVACLKSFTDNHCLINDIFLSCSRISNAIVLMPEFRTVAHVAANLRNILGSRVCELHSRLTPAKRAEAVRRIAEGEADIVVGTRSAVLAPMSRVSLIITVQEHSPSYKAQEGLRYNARDVAVMRGYMNNAPVLLTSVSPSLESIHNCITGKYRFLGSSSQDMTDFSFPGREGRPAVKVVKLSAKSRRSGCFAHEVVKKSGDVLRANGSMLFMINRKGYSLIRCEECGETLNCADCGVPYIFYKSGARTRCGLCGAAQGIPETCPSCNGYKLEPFGSGVERIKEELDKLLGTDAVMLHKSAPQTSGKRDGSNDEQQSDVLSFCVGTAHAVREIGNNSLNSVVFISAESMMSRPDFRAKERAFQEIMEASELVQAGGSVYIQSYRPGQNFLRNIRSYDFRSIYVDELADRRALDYPPFSNIILFSVNNASDRAGVERVISEISSECCGRRNSVLFFGPVPVFTGRGSRLQFFMKSRDSVRLHKAALMAIKRLDSIRLNYTVDVDPLKI
ncbi:MAG: primosomal protein N' [Dissulfurispiraceae bacterium]|jgi:primosomal protein N' (replication factor Y)|nr:primosomal protein N' [Dissulfurispiraceae bacterium]